MNNFDAVPPPSCTVVIATRDRPSHLTRALECVAEQDHRPFDVLVVDNAPSNTDAEAVCARWHVPYVVEPQRGLSRARNRGVRESSSDIIAFIDDDALAQPAWLGHLLLPFFDPQVAVVTGRVFPWTGESDSIAAACIRGADSDGRFGGEHRLVLSRESANWLELTAFGGFGIGTNMAVRRSAFLENGGCDVLLGPGAPLFLQEEYYLHFSLLKRGYKGVYTPDAAVVHPFSPREDDHAKRYLDSRRAVTAFVTLMLARHPEHASAILRYVIRRLAAGKSGWGRSGFAKRPSNVSRREVLRALAVGPVLYWKHAGRGAAETHMKTVNMH